MRSHLSRERCRELVKLAKNAFKAAHNGRLYCEVHGFDFGLMYGELDFIEAHHRVPLFELKPGILTKISDLGMVCANCYSVLHRGRSWLSIAEFKARLQNLM